MYHSPFHLIDPEIFKAGDDASALKRRLGLEKRKLLAEFELAGTAAIHIRGRELQRQDLTALFDELQAPELLDIHLQIWRHGRFLRFLETGIPGDTGDWLYPSGETGNALLRFVSPHYAEALDRYLQRCLQGQDKGEALLYELRTESWLLPAHQEAAYRYTTRFFTEKKNELLGIRYRAEQKQQVVATEIRDWCSDQQIHVLNRLPDRFDDLRYVLTELLNNLCVLYDRQQAKKHALAAIERAATIRVNDEELERLVPSNLRIIRNKDSSGLVRVDPDTGKRRVKLIPLLVTLVFLVRLLTAGAGCFDKSDDTRSEIHRLPVRSMTDRRPEEESFSSLIRALNAPEAFTPADTALEKPLLLHKPSRTGRDPFADLLAVIQHHDDTLAMQPSAPADSSSVLLRNNSVAQAIFLLQLDARLQRSVYIAPGEAFELRYPNLALAMHIYAGRDWSDTLWNSYLLYKTSSFAVRQVFRGGFRTLLTVSGEETAGHTPMFSLPRPPQGMRDTFTLISEPGGALRIQYNPGAD